MDVFPVMFPWWSLLGLLLVFAVACVAFLKSQRRYWVLGITSAISAALFCYGFNSAADFYACTGAMYWLLTFFGIVLGPFYIIGGVCFVCTPMSKRGR